MRDIADDKAMLGLLARVTRSAYARGTYPAVNKDRRMLYSLPLRCMSSLRPATYALAKA